MRALVLAFVLVGLAGVGRAKPDDPVFIVVVHPKNSSSALDKKLVADAFLKKRTRWGDDEAIQPIDQSKKSSVRAQFSRRILDRSVASVRTYWNQLVFSGRGVPPPEADSDTAVIEYVAANPGAIGYVSSTADTKRVKVVQVR